MSTVIGVYIYIYGDYCRDPLLRAPFSLSNLGFADSLNSWCFYFILGA